MHVRIVDDAGVDVKPGQAGEIWIRGPSVFSGYDSEEQTREAFSSEGWFKSGDTAIWLDREFVKVLGRTSVDIIKSGGYKLSALEIEEALREYPSVDDAAVIGVEDATWGEAVVAVVLASSVVGEGALREFLKSRLAPYKLPKAFCFVDEFPRNLMGKVDKQKLKTDVVRRLGGVGDGTS
jgi:malonyl-CoA/methylmalonyl-CoA synthetase